MEGYERYVGQTLDNRYRIDKIIGVGGMAVVFRAFDILAGRNVAVKILKDDIARDEVSVKRFINESKAVSMLSHPNIVTIYDVSVRSDAKYIVMEYIEGITLKNYMLKKGKMETGEILSMIEQVLGALEHAHQKGIVHRDIKPQNIMLLKNGIVKVTDFGIAKLPNAETVTVKDSAIGTVFYISPEQASGSKIDARSDIYSLGVMMYEMATGKLPFTADSPVSVALMQINDTARPVREENPDIPLGLSQIIERAMNKDPELRYQSAGQMLRQVSRLKEDPNATFKAPKKKKGAQKFRMSRGMLPIILAITLAFLIIAVTAGAVLVNRLFLSGESGDTITVDDFAGRMFTDELQSYFDASDIYHLKLDQVYDASAPAGYIISQDPEAGSSRKIDPGKKKCEITLKVSKGPRTMTMIDVAALDYREARVKLRQMGLVVKTESIESDVYEVGYVISTSPAYGEVLEAGDTVTIYVSSGSSGEKITVPNFVGKTESATLAQVVDAGLLIGEVTYEESDKYEAGLVIKQSISAGSEAYRNSVIDFVVSLGKKVETTEEVTTEAETTEEVTTEAVTTEEPPPTRPVRPDETDEETETTDTVTEEVTETDDAIPARKS